MKASDLMIGDLVNLSPGKANIPNYVMIHAIKYDNNVSKDYVFDIVFLSTGLVQYNYSIRSLKPIPLTPEILEKNGFHYTNEHTLKGADTYILRIEQRGYDLKVTIKLNDYFALDSYDGRVYRLAEISTGKWYVHHLQHALRLCGIEKEIKL